MKKLLVMLLMLATVVFISCDKEEDESGPLTAKEAKEELADLGENMGDMITNMENSDGMSVFMYMTSLPDPFSVPNKSAGDAELFNKIEKYLLPTTILNKLEALPNFDFNNLVGTYTWNFISQNWDVTFGTPADKIIINFPSNETATTNDAVLTIYNYHETLIDDGYGGYYSPDLISADIKVDGVKYLGLEMNATWVNDGPPSALSVDAYIMPFNFIVDFDMGSLEANLDAKIKYNGTTVFSTGVGATWASSMDDEPETISGFIQLYDVKFTANVELADLFEAMEAFVEPPTIEEMNTLFNSYITARVYVGGDFAAKILADFTDVAGAGFPIDEEAGIYLDILFEFSDGSTTSAIPYFATFAEQLITFVGSLQSYFNGGEISK